VTDMRMPVMDGAQFLEQVAARWPSTVRLLMTGYADAAATIAAANNGRVFRFLGKPWVHEEVTAAIRDAFALTTASPESSGLSDSAVGSATPAGTTDGAAS
jgi:response regulator RpfG family c-di-GMP phosphodiesterase